MAWLKLFKGLEGIFQNTKNLALYNLQARLHGFKLNLLVSQKVKTRSIREFQPILHGFKLLDLHGFRIFEVPSEHKTPLYQGLSG